MIVFHDIVEANEYVKQHRESVVAIDYGGDIITVYEAGDDVPSTNE